MFKESIARRYSAALFALAKESGTVAPTVTEFDAFVGALEKNPDLALFYESPVIDRVQKQAMLAKALAHGSELVLNFVLLLVRKRRENLARLIARQLHELLDQEAGRDNADIQTPTPLAAHELAELARRLSKVYGRTIVPQPKVSPGLLGGMVVQVGDKYVDASVAGKLEELRRHLLASADTWPATSTNGHINEQRTPQ